MHSHSQSSPSISQSGFGPARTLLALATLSALSTVASSKSDRQRAIDFQYSPAPADGHKGPGIGREARFGNTRVHQQVTSSKVYYEDSRGGKAEQWLTEEATLPKARLAQVFDPDNPVPGVCHSYYCFETACSQRDLDVHIVGTEPCDQTLTVIGKGTAAAVCNMTGPFFASCRSSEPLGLVEVLHPEL